MRGIEKDKIFEDNRRLRKAIEGKKVIEGIYTIDTIKNSKFGKALKTGFC